jgi:hypothetical protein
MSSSDDDCEDLLMSLAEVSVYLPGEAMEMKCVGGEEIE